MWPFSNVEVDSRTIYIFRDLTYCYECFKCGGIRRCQTCQIHKFLYLKSLLKLDVQSEGWKMVILIKREKRLVLIINLLFFYLSLVEKVEEN